MTDPADRHLEDRLHALARGVHVPVVPAGDDVRRGRRRLMRMRLAMAGAITGTLAVVLGVTGLTAGDPSASEPPVADPPSTSLPVDPTPSQSEEERSTEGATGGGPAKDVDQPPATDPTGSVETEADTGRIPVVAGEHGSDPDTHADGELGSDHRSHLGPDHGPARPADRDHHGPGAQGAPLLQRRGRRAPRPGS
jgi:hypothetical protein